MPAAAIVAAILAVGGVIVSAAISSSDTKDAQNEARELSKVKRQDDLNFQRSQERLEKLTLAQRKREARMQNEESRKNREQREKEFAFGQRESFFDKQIGMLNSSEVMRSNFANNFRRAA
jgi:TolA-binding protein